MLWIEGMLRAEAACGQLAGKEGKVMFILPILMALAPAADTAPAADRVFACRSITDDPARLACFDKAAADLSQALERKEVVIAAADDPRIQPAREPAPKVVDGTISSVVSLSYDRYIFQIDGKTAWQFDEPSYSEPKIGDVVHVEKGALGSYIARVKGRRGLRVKRLH